MQCCVYIIIIVYHRATRGRQELTTYARYSQIINASKCSWEYAMKLFALDGRPLRHFAGFPATNAILLRPRCPVMSCSFRALLAANMVTVASPVAIVHFTDDFQFHPNCKTPTCLAFLVEKKDPISHDNSQERYPQFSETYDMQEWPETCNFQHTIS